MMYAAVPPEGVEEAKALWAARETKHRRKRRAPTRRIEDLRQYEQGDYEKFYSVRITTMRLTTYFSQIARMAFWHEAPSRDLAMLSKALNEHEDEMLDHMERLALAKEALRLRVEDDEVRARIEKLSRYTTERGASDGEAANAVGRIAALRAKLPD
jgi:hypothetical protein